jgi:hypothetical protein
MSARKVSVTDLECPCSWDTPQRPRDFDFEGSFDALQRECELDSKGTGYMSYKALGDQGNLNWAVWRET